MVNIVLNLTLKLLFFFLDLLLYLHLSLVFILLLYLLLLLNMLVVISLGLRFYLGRILLRWLLFRIAKLFGVICFDILIVVIYFLEFLLFNGRSRSINISDLLNASSDILDVFFKLSHFIHCYCILTYTHTPLSSYLRLYIISSLWLLLVWMLDGRNKGVLCSWIQTSVMRHQL